MKTAIAINPHDKAVSCNPCNSSTQAHIKTTSLRSV